MNPTPVQIPGPATAIRFKKALEAISVGVFGRGKILDKLKVRGNAPTDWQIARVALGEIQHSPYCPTPSDYMGAGIPPENGCSTCWAMWFVMNGLKAA